MSRTIPHKVRVAVGIGVASVLALEGTVRVALVVEAHDLSRRHCQHKKLTTKKQLTRERKKEAGKESDSREGRKRSGHHTSPA